jgi:hypothetical protein
VPARRSRWQLALVVAEWAFEQVVEGRYDRSAGDCMPEWPFREDEIAIVESLEGGEVLLAGAVFSEVFAARMKAAGKKKSARKLATIADSLYARSGRWYDDLCGWTYRPRLETRSRVCRPRPRARRRPCRAPPVGDDPDESDDVDRARRGWSL